MFRSISSSRHADAITPTEPLDAVAISSNGNGLPLNSGGSASATSPFRGLLGVHSRFGLPVRSITQGDLYQSTSTHSLPPCVALVASGRATDWPGGIRTHWRSPTFTAYWVVDAVSRVDEF